MNRQEMRKPRIEQIQKMDPIETQSAEGLSSRISYLQASCKIEKTIEAKEKRRSNRFKT